MAEQRVVASAPQPIMPRAHVHSPTLGEIGGRGQLGQHDHVIFTRQRGTHDAVPAIDQLGYELL
jgi:hypothetical protein